MDALFLSHKLSVSGSIPSLSLSDKLCTVQPLSFFVTG